MKTIKGLVKTKEKMYVYLESKELAEKFLIQAEAEGFTFGDGVKPTERHTSNLFTVYGDMTISYVGTVGHIYYQTMLNSPDSIIVNYTNDGIFF